MFDFVVSFGRDHTVLYFALTNLVPLFIFHFSRGMLHGRTGELAFFGLLLVYVYFIAELFYTFFLATKIQYIDLVGAAIAYACFLFVLLSEVMIQGFGKVLTRWRGEKWVKEIDYLYLAFGAVGLALSTNRLEVVEQKFSLPDYLGPFIIATALVVRAIKTRAEINGWNKASA